MGEDNQRVKRFFNGFDFPKFARFLRDLLTVLIVSGSLLFAVADRWFVNRVEYAEHVKWGAGRSAEIEKTTVLQQKLNEDLLVEIRGLRSDLKTAEESRQKLTERMVRMETLLERTARENGSK